MQEILIFECFPAAKCNLLCFSLGPALPSKQVCKSSLCSLAPLSLKVKENSNRELVLLRVAKAVTGLHQGSKSVGPTIPCVETTEKWALWLPAGKQEKQTRKEARLL